MKTLRLADDKALTALIRGSHVKIAGESREPVKIVQDKPKSAPRSAIDGVEVGQVLQNGLPPRKPRMNGTETAWAQILEARKRAGEILWYEFEGIKLRLADSTFYTPDFAIMMPDSRLEFHEIKGGFIRDDAAVKLKVAAEHFPFRFCLIRKQSRNGGWDIRDVARGL